MHWRGVRAIVACYPTGKTERDGRPRIFYSKIKNYVKDARHQKKKKDVRVAVSPQCDRSSHICAVSQMLHCFKDAVGGSAGLPATINEIRDSTNIASNVMLILMNF